MTIYVLSTDNLYAYHIKEKDNVYMLNNLVGIMARVSTLGV